MSIHTRAVVAMRPGDVLRDTSVPGLHLRCFSNRKSFYLYYRTRDGRERRPKLGDFGVALNLEQARRIARKMLGAVAEGRDPVAEQGRAESSTVRALGERYLRDHAAKKKSAGEDRRQLERYIFPAIGALPIAAVSYVDISGLHGQLRAKPYQANRVLALLSKMFNLAEKWGLRDPFSNPCRHVTRFKERKRKRYLRPESEAPAIAALLRKYEAGQPRAVAFIRLLLLTGARPDEIRHAKREWIERHAQGGATLHLPDSKTGPRTVILAPQALAVVDVLDRPEDGTLTGIKSPRKLWEKIRKEAGCPDLRLYDTRHHFASVMLRAGYSLAQIGELLGHRSTQTTKRYAHLMDDAAHAAAANAANVLERMMAAGPALLALDYSSNPASSPSSASSEAAAGLT